jgi:hypothetical protein
MVLRYVDLKVQRAASRGRAGARPVPRVAWAVRSMSRLVPRSTCLVQALSMQLLLSLQGDASELHIGVAREADMRFIAHAWVEIQGTIVIGAAHGTRYVRLPNLRPILHRKQTPRAAD